MNFVNLTPHDVSISMPDGSSKLLPKSGKEARCDEVSELVGEWEGIPLYVTAYGEVIGLPQVEEGTVFIVSFMVRAALPHRSDLASPGKLVRDDKGQIIGCKGLVVNR